MYDHEYTNELIIRVFVYVFVDGVCKIRISFLGWEVYLSRIWNNSMYRRIPYPPWSRPGSSPQEACHFTSSASDSLPTNPLSIRVWSPALNIYLNTARLAAKNFNYLPGSVRQVILFSWGVIWITSKRGGRRHRQNLAIRNTCSYYSIYVFIRFRR